MKSIPDVVDWYNTTLYYLKCIRDNLETLTRCKEGDTILNAFPKNPGNCTMYNSLCPYHPFCCAWANPLQRCEEPELGFAQKYWDPRDIKETAKHVIEVGSDTKEEI